MLINEVGAVREGYGSTSSSPGPPSLQDEMHEESQLFDTVRPVANLRT